jgi:hypothetical protein
VSPSLNEALTAWATVAAVVVALYFGVRSELRALATARSAQAAKVSAWLELDAEHATYGDGLQPVLVIVRNASDGLIYNVWVQHYQHQKVQSPLFLDVVPPEESRRIRAAGMVGEPWSVPFDLEFTDAAGVTWLRRSDGSLTGRGGKRFRFLRRVR